ncbi:hypothetical protein Tco_0999763 [Tanacetum coccineum]
MPPSLDYTPAFPDYSPASDSKSDPYENPSSYHIPPLPATSLFLSSDDDTIDNDTSDTPQSPTHGTPFTEITSSTQRSPVIPHRRVMILAPYSPWSTASSDFHSDASFDSSLRHSLFDHSSPDLPALSPVRADLIPSPKRVRDSGYLADVEVDPRETSLRDDIIVRGNEEPHLESRSRGTDIEVDDDVERSDGMDIDPVEAVIEACFDFADIIRTSRVDVRVEAITVARDDVETGTRDPIVVSDDRDTPPVVLEVIPEPAQEGAAGGTYETLGSLVQRIVRVESAVTALTKRIAQLERDNRRLRGTASVESQRVDRLQRGISRMQRELRQIRRF